MLQVMLVFVYMGITCGLSGYGLLTFLARLGIFRTEGKAYTFRHRSSYLLAGIACVTAYAQIFSLFAPVGLVANILLTALCLLIAWCCRKQMFSRILARTGYGSRAQLPDGYLLTHRIWLFYILLFLVIAYGTSHGIMHYDTGLYHAQSIRFIEEYGCVRGLANLHSRLGYNSAFFAFSALYSFAFTGAASLHAGNGFLALLLSFACLDIKHILRRGHPVLTDFVRFAGIYYLFNIFKEIVSPAPDAGLVCYLICLLILWVDLDVRREKQILPYVLLAAGFCFAVTIKLSAAALVLLALKPVAMILSDAGRRLRGQCAESPRAPWRKRIDAQGLWGLLCLAGLVLVSTLPWLIRNAFISGWILFPSTVPDLFSFPWKVPEDLAQGDAAYIRAFARGFTSPAEPGAGEKIGAWLKPWFASQSMVSRILLAADLCSLIGFVVWLCVCIRKKMARSHLQGMSKSAAVLKLSSRYLMRDRDFLFLEGVLLISFLFWFLEAPLPRYGFFYIWMPSVIFFGRLLLVLANRLSEGRLAGMTRLCSLFLLAFLIYKGVRLMLTDMTLMRSGYLIVQQPYEHFTAASYEVDGVTFYYPVEGDRTGYFAFPGGDHQADIRLLGDELRDGIATVRESATSQ